MLVLVLGVRGDRRRAGWGIEGGLSRRHSFEPELIGTDVRAWKKSESVFVCSQLATDTDGVTPPPPHHPILTSNTQVRDFYCLSRRFPLL